MPNNRKLAWEAVRRHLEAKAWKRAQADLEQQRREFYALAWQPSADDQRFLRALRVDPR